MSIVKPNKPSGTMHNFSQMDPLCSSLPHGNLSEYLTVILFSTHMTTPGISIVSAAGWRLSTIESTVSSNNKSHRKPTTLHRNLMSYGQSLHEGERCQIMHDVNT